MNRKQILEQGGKVHQSEPYYWSEKRKVQMAKPDGEPIVSLTDVVDLLEIHANAWELAREDFLKDEVREIYVDHNQQRELTFKLIGITEKGVREIAEQFQHYPSRIAIVEWLAEMMQNLPEFRVDALIKEESEVEKLQRQIAEMQPKVDYCNSLEDSDELYNVTEIADAYGLTAKQLNDMLEDLGVQYKQDKLWVMNHKYKDKGYARQVRSTRPKKNGGEKAFHILKWTEKGRGFIYHLLAANDVFPLNERAKRSECP